MNKIILIGGGGHCKVVINILRRLNQYEIAGISDTTDKIGQTINGINCICSDEELEKQFQNGVCYGLITLGSIKDNNKRLKLYNLAIKIGFDLPVIIDPDTIIAKSVSVGKGTVIMPGVIINPDVIIGNNCVINTGSIIEHDCNISDHVHVTPGCTISGGVAIGPGAFIGIGTTIMQGRKIGSNVTIGAGANVIKDIEDNSIVVGNPARIIKKKAKDNNLL